MLLTWLKMSGLLLTLSGAITTAESPHLIVAPDMNEARAGHTATFLPGGRVLIAGGCVVDGCDGGLTASAELYNPEAKHLRQNFNACRGSSRTPSLPALHEGAYLRRVGRR